MSDQQDKQSASLERVSDELVRSLRRCRLMMNDYRASLSAANSNESKFMLASKEEDEQDA